ncbi:MAG: K(+)-transporting ATPase subunit C [Saprospiraceae bacterium]|nr:K(+)-transporting ATPase subunit C [Saprospiraceae bacterium]
MKEPLLPALKLTLLTLVLFSGVYTLAVWGVAQLSPNGGEGETISNNGKTYYENIGQKFTDDRYFWSRPSAVDYNAAGSGGSNKAASNPDYVATVQARIDSFLVYNPGVAKAEIPVDLVTASGSGLDPHISPKAAQVQVQRIARLRNLPPEKVQALVAEHTEKPLVGLFGPERVNVLKLNIALDNLK